MPKAGDKEPGLMTHAELKPLLRLSRRRPLACAICMTKDNEAVLLVDRRIKPRKVMAQMRRDAKDSDIALNLPTLRFGRAAVDGGSDSQKVTFTVNKLVPGAMSRALLLLLRPVGYQRCDIVVDEGLETETDEGVEGGEDDDEYSTEAKPETASAPAQQPEADALRGVLLGLVKEMAPAIQHDPDRKPALIDLATGVQNSLRDGDIEAATQSIHDLEAALHPKQGKLQTDAT